MHTSLRALLLLALSILLVPGCGAAVSRARTSGGAARAGSASIDSASSQFPTRADLQQASATTPTHAPREADTGAVVDRWEIDPVSLAAQPGAFEAVATSLAAAGSTVTPAARCTAREVARFAAAHGTLPNDYLRDYLGARCGITAGSFAVAIHGWRVTGMSEAEVAAQQTSAVESGFRPHVSAGSRIGVASAAAGDQLVVALVIEGRAPLALSLPAALSPVDGHVRFGGAFDAPHAEVVALASHGASAVERCAVLDVAGRLDVDCPIAASDDVAWISVSYRADGGVLLRGAASLLVVARPDAGLVYEERAIEVGANGSVEARMLEGINRVRASLGLGPATLAAAQSAANAEAMSVYLDSGDPQLEESAILYAMAGWDVQGVVAHGSAYAFALPATTDPGRWVAYVMQHPLQRWGLLHPDISQIAIGTSMGESGSARGVMIGVYSMMSAPDPAAERARVLAAIQRARGEAGLPQVAQLGPYPSLAARAALISSGRALPSEALDALARDGAHMQGADGVAVLITQDLDTVTLDGTLRAARALDVAVAHHRPEGSAWGFYVVLVATAR